MMAATLANWRHFHAQMWTDPGPVHVHVCHVLIGRFAYVDQLAKEVLGLATSKCEPRD